MDKALSNKIIDLTTRDIRFPTSARRDGSDAANADPDYSAAYITITTEKGDRGCGLIFTIGRGNNLCCQAVENMRHLVLGSDFEAIKTDISAFYDRLRSDSQLRWLGPEKGIIHMAVGGSVNAVWDMWARAEGKPVWRLLADMSAEEFVGCMDFRYVSDAITRDEALEIVERNTATRTERIARLERGGYPAYTTSPGWLGYSDAKLRRLCADAVARGLRHIKIKVGGDLRDDVRRCRIVREIIGADSRLMIDANQVWEVGEAVAWLRELEPFSPWFIEEPTSPDDVLGHREIRNSINGMKVATGEHCQNRILFKQFITSQAVDIVQLDACRLAGLNEILTVYMIAAKYGKLVCPHAGGVGLCEYAQHLSMIDYVRISAEIDERMIEYVDHLHEHFVDPCRVREGAYLAPEAPGFSVEMFASTLERYRYPDGAEWRSRLGGGD